MDEKLILLLGCVALVNAHFTIEVNNPNPALDNELFEKVLDDEECKKQVKVIQNNTVIFLQFIDAGLKIPRWVTQGNLVDMGNYNLCLGIKHKEEIDIQGKYCLIQVPTEQNLTLPWNMQWSGFDPTELVMDDKTLDEVRRSENMRADVLRTLGVWDDGLRSTPGDTSITATFSLALCVPKPCSTEAFISEFFFNITEIGFQYDDRFCRLPDDKPWSPADTTATVVFSIIGLLTLLCTSYDLVNKFFFKNDPKLSHPIYTSFSIYTNSRRLMSFTSNPGTLHCLDGIRALAMAWVVIGHSFTTENFIYNRLDVLDFGLSRKSIWIVAAPITVDTFFSLAGLVLVYSIAGKMSGVQLVKNLHVFYLNRLFRLTPLLATAILLQASFFNRFFDGPVWTMVVNQTNYCRTTWWLTLLHLQTFINPTQICIAHSWYVAIDFHCYFVSPLVIFWVLKRPRKMAWTALTIALILSLTGATIYNFIKDFPSGLIEPHPNRPIYQTDYYLNTLTRASPFFVGMIFGYILHILRGKKLELPWMTTATLWVCAATVSTTIFFYPSIISSDWDNQIVDNFMNSFMRPAWCTAIGWMIVACVHGYAGPINWFLSLDVWKLPSRISYAMFIFHYPLMFSINSSALAPIHFSVAGFTFKFFAHMTVTVLLSFFLTLIIDAPFSTLCKLLFEGNKKKTVTKMDEKEVGNSPSFVNGNNGVVENEVSTVTVSKRR